MPIYLNAQNLLDMYWEPSVVTNHLIEDLNATLVEFDITTTFRIRHFISQATHECDFGRGLVEYDSGEDYKPGEGDLGNLYKDDGPKYRGAGAIHLTGRYNYQRFSEYVGDPRVMEGCYYVAAHYPWRSGGFFWQDKGLNAVVDRGRSVTEVTAIVNGGSNGLKQRQMLYERAVALDLALPSLGYNPGPPPTRIELDDSFFKY